MTHRALLRLALVGVVVLATTKPTLAQRNLTRFVYTGTYAGKPAAGLANQLAIITDCVDTSCSTGGGSTVRLMRDTGSAWAVLGDGDSDSGGSPAFSSITAGTNTAALVVGTNGSLTVSGSGTINATSLGGTAAASYALLNSPSFTTPTLGAASATSIAFGADPADAGSLRLSNNTAICWEAATPGTDLCLTLNASNEFELNAPLNVTSTAAALLLTGVTSPSAPGTAEQWYFYADSVDNLPKYIYNGESEQTFYTTANPQTTISGNAGTATALASNPTDCSANQFANAIAASGNLTCAAIADGDVPDTITASNYMPLAGSTFTGAFVPLSGTAPTTNAAGQVAFDTNAWATSFGAIQVYNGTANTYLIGVEASDTPGNGQVLKWNTGGTITWENDSGGGTGCVTGGSNNQILTDDGATGCSSEPAAQISSGALTLGTAGSVVGSVVLNNATSGTVTIQPTTGALGTVTVTLPAANSNTVQPDTGAANNFLTAISSLGVISKAQPTWANLASGTGTNLTLDVEGTGNSITTVSRTSFMAAGGTAAAPYLLWNALATNAPTATCAAGSTETTLLDCYASFADADGDVSIQIPFFWPSDWTGANVDLKFKWKAAATSGDVVWQATLVCRADAEINDAAFNSTNTVTDTAKGTTLQLNDASITGMTLTGCAAGELATLKVLRNRTHASDTITGAVLLEGVEMTSRRTQ